MKIKSLKLLDAFLSEPEKYSDNRGIFSETYNKKKLSNILKKEINFVQDNHSSSCKNVLRGLHFQKKPKSQGKLIKVIRGKIYDVIVDIRKSSGTFMQWEGIELSSENNTQIWIPEGFAHGFLALCDNTEVVYKVTQYYDPKFEYSIRYNDPKLHISWPKTSEYIISEKDKNADFLSEKILFE